MGEVQEERLVDVLAKELDRPFDVATGEHRLVGLLLDHVLPVHQRQRRIGKHGGWREPDRSQRVGVLEVGVADLGAHVVAVRQPEPSVEPVVGRQELGLIATVPLADDLGGVAGVAEHRRDRVLVGVEPEAHAGEEDVQSVEVVEADARRVRAGQHGPARRRTHGGGHVEAGEPHTFTGELIDPRRVVEFGSVAAEVAVAEVVAVDQHDVGTAHHGRRLGAGLLRVDSEMRLSGDGIDAGPRESRVLHG